MINDSGTEQEFTAFISDNPYTFAAVGFGTYTVQVETQQCTGDPLNGILPPRQSLDDSGNPIVIGAGLAPLDAATEVNSSFGCSNITNVDIALNVSGGAAPYTYTVNGGPVQPAFGNTGTNTGSTTFGVASSGTYDFLITDANNCTITASADVEELLPPVVTATGDDGDCTNGGARINFNVSNARGYDLSFRVGPAEPWVTTSQIPVPADPSGTLYDQLEVRYEQGGFSCSFVLGTALTVRNLGAVVGSAAKVADVACDGSGGTTGGQIDFIGPFSGGTGTGYSFSWMGLIL